MGLEPEPEPVPGVAPGAAAGRWARWPEASVAVGWWAVEAAESGRVDRGAQLEPAAAAAVVVV